MIPELTKRPRVASFRRALTIDEMRFLGTQTTLVGLDLKDCPIGDDHVREICALPRLVNLTLSGTEITDVGLMNLAKLPKVMCLFADRTRITGTALRYFHDHPKLEVLWVNDTAVTDDTITLVTTIPKLQTLRIENTAVTFAGLLALAKMPRLDVVTGDQFTPEQIAEFDTTRRRLAGGSAVRDPADAATATAVLLAFFDAMNGWEKQMTASGGDRIERRCATIFDQYATPKARKLNRGIGRRSHSDPPEYTGETIVDTEQPSKTKLFFYTRDERGIQRRYTLMRSADGWRVDRRDAMFGGWKWARL